MTQPKVDNKWGEDCYLRFEKLAIKLKREGKELNANEFWKFLILEITQTQQETLEWCLKEVVRENEKETDWFNDNIARNVLRKGQRQTIKKRMEGND